MGYEAKVLADSISANGHRLTTLEVTLPRFVLAEFNTHRVLSRNSASSRAIPTKKRFNDLLDDPFVPDEWRKNQPGMQAGGLLSPENADRATHNWLLMRDCNLLGTVALLGGLDGIDEESARERMKTLIERYPAIWQEFQPLDGEGAHKQWVNRPTETWQWHTIIASGTEWDNFFALRTHKDAQPEIQKAALLMRLAMQESSPHNLRQSEWHLPFIREEEKRQFPAEQLAKFAVARCARVSYETHDTGKIDHAKDLELHDQLKGSGHMSPFEHVAYPMNRAELSFSEFSGNFRGWNQYRKDIANEDNYGAVLEGVSIGGIPDETKTIGAHNVRSNR